MDKYGELEAFVQVIDGGSLSAAARTRGTTPSAVSRVLKRLELRLGARLLDRTTRRLRPTAEGRVLYERAQRILREIHDAEQAVASTKGALRGRVRINASVPLANHCIIPLLPALRRRLPGLKIDLRLSDDLVDVLGDDTDVVLRVGPLRDSSLVARKIASIRRFVVAAPSYLREAGTPTHPEQLRHHECLAFNLHDRLNAWPFQIDGALTRLPVRGHVSVDNGESMRYLALAGVGIARLGEFLVGEDIRQDRLVPLLEPFNPRDEMPVHLLFAGRRNLALRVRALVDFLAEHLQDDDARRG